MRKIRIFICAIIFLVSLSLLIFLYYPNTSASHKTTNKSSISGNDRGSGKNSRKKSSSTNQSEDSIVSDSSTKQNENSIESDLPTKQNEDSIVPDSVEPDLPTKQNEYSIVPDSPKNRNVISVKPDDHIPEDLSLGESLPLNKCISEYKTNSSSVSQKIYSSKTTKIEKNSIVSTNGDTLIKERKSNDPKIESPKIEPPKIESPKIEPPKITLTEQVMIRHIDNIKYIDPHIFSKPALMDEFEKYKETLQIYINDFKKPHDKDIEFIGNYLNKTDKETKECRNHWLSLSMKFFSYRRYYEEIDSGIEKLLALNKKIEKKYDNYKKQKLNNIMIGEKLWDERIFFYSYTISSDIQKSMKKIRSLHLERMYFQKEENNLKKTKGFQDILYSLIFADYLNLINVLKYVRIFEYSHGYLKDSLDFFKSMIESYDIVRGHFSKKSMEKFPLKNWETKEKRERNLKAINRELHSTFNKIKMYAGVSSSETQLKINKNETIFSQTEDTPLVIKKANTR